MPRHLETYLSDHLAGAAAAIALLRQLVRRFLIPELRDLLVEIEADRQTLEVVMREAGIRRRPAKHRLAQAGEKLVEWRMRVTGAAGPYELFQGLEYLAMGITGKRCLWRALESIRTEEPALRWLDLESLDLRAGDQLAVVEAQRLIVARHAFDNGRPVSDAG